MKLKIEQMIDVQRENDQMTFKTQHMNGYQDISLDGLMTALLDEIVEMNRKIKRPWGWLEKSESSVYKDLALESFANVIRLALIQCLKNEEEARYFGGSELENVIYRWNSVWETSLTSEIEPNILDLVFSVLENRSSFIFGELALFAIGMGWTEDEVFDIYMRKNQ